MNVRVKLYALLGKYLPSGAKDNEVEITVETGTTIVRILESLNVPREECHLVLVNGIYVAPGERESHCLNEGDALAVWPPVAGG